MESITVLEVSEWTRERIYRGAANYIPPAIEGPMGMYPMPPRPVLNNLDDPRNRTFTEEFLATLKSETEWVKADIAPLTADEAGLIGSGKPCPRCINNQFLRKQTGVTTGVVIVQHATCPCVVIKAFLRVWRDPNMVPVRFRDIRLTSLKAVDPPTSKLAKDTQQKYLDILNDNPTGSYLLFGDAGTGKTHFSFALFHHAVRTWARQVGENDSLWERSVFRFNTKALLDQHVAWETRDKNSSEDATPYPDLFPNQIRALAAKGHKVSLFLDELDKFNPTKYKLDTLFSLIDAVYESKGQLVAISNSTVLQLQNLWREFPACDAIIRRICGDQAEGKFLEFLALK